MSKIWQIKPKIEDSFIKKYPEYDRLTLQLLYNRGLTEKSAIELFLDPDYEKYGHDPFSFRNMEAATGLIIEKIKAREKILVYGDYDADGVTATTILAETLKNLKAEVDIYIPDRTSEGYGLNRRAIKENFDRGAKLIITVDNGIRNREEVAYARSLGLEVIVTDHHVAPDDLPDCPVINPIAPGETYPYKFLAGVGVALKFSSALVRRSTLAEDDKRKLEARLMDLAAIGTVADCVPLTGENRLIVKRGLEVLNKTRRRGLLELIRAAKIDGGRKLDAWNIGFQIAPRLNAAGRMDHANTAFELLNTAGRGEAEALARDLNEKNIDRQRETENIMRQVEAGLDLSGGAKIIIAASPSVAGAGETWNEGVIGLVAGRLADRYCLPAIVVTGDGEEMKASGRSIPEFNLIEAIEKTSDDLLKYGGHAMACGFSLKGKDSLERFRKNIMALADEKLKGLDLRPKLTIEAEIDFGLVDETLVRIMDRFAPFGEGNERPVLASRELSILDIVSMGLNGQHIKLRVKNGSSPVVSALGFGQAAVWQDLRIGDKIDLAYRPEMNEFNGRSEVQVKIVDLSVAR